MWDISFGRRIRFGLLLLASLVAGPVWARPDDRWYVFISDHDPRQFWTMIHTADDMLANGGRFRIYMNARGVLLGYVGSTMTQKDYMEIHRRRPGLELMACKETIDRLMAGLKGRRAPPLLPGLKVVPCHGVLSELDKEGWRRVPGFGL